MSVAWNMLDDLSDFAGPPRTREEVFEIFKDAVRLVWNNPDFVLPVLELSPEESSGGVYASVAYRPPVKAIGNSLLVRAPRYLLRISGRLLSADDNVVRGIMIHEAVHLGYERHTREFRDLVRANGGAVSEMATESGGEIHVQKKVGSRFVTLKTFPSDQEREARAWGRGLAQANPGQKYRLKQ